MKQNYSTPASILKTAIGFLALIFALSFLCSSCKKTGAVPAGATVRAILKTDQPLIVSFSLGGQQISPLTGNVSEFMSPDILESDYAGRDFFVNIEFLQAHQTVNLSIYAEDQGKTGQAKYCTLTNNSDTLRPYSLSVLNDFK